MVRPTSPVEPRFWSKVSIGKQSDCWLWQRNLNVWGYGVFKTKEGNRGSHRIAWALTNGEIPVGLHVLHRCDVRACCNPSHLFLGTNADNAEDRHAKGRDARAEGHGRAKLTFATANQIRTSTGSLREIAERFGVGKSTIHRVRRLENWR